MIVAIDGPSGAGKSTVARMLAARLGFPFLDTGAMYRAVALAAIEQGLNLEDAGQVAAAAQRATIEVRDQQTRLNGRDVSSAIRTPEVTEATRWAANNPEVRRRLVELQREVGKSASNLVTEGRDQGSVVFPDAECKIYLTATIETRARRRQQDFAEQGQEVPLEEVKRQIAQRDLSDSSRAVGPLKKADDAVEFFTDGLTLDQIVDRLAEIVYSTRGA